MPWASRYSLLLGHLLGFSCQMKSGHREQGPCNTCSPTTLGSQGNLLFLLLVLMIDSKDATTPFLVPSIHFASPSPVPVPHSLCSWPRFLDHPGRQDHKHSLTAPSLHTNLTIPTVLPYLAFPRPPFCSKAICSSDRGLLPSFFNFFLCNGSFALSL